MENMFINVTLWPAKCFYNKRETASNYKQKIIIFGLFCLFVCFCCCFFVVFFSFFKRSSNKECNNFEKEWQTISSSEERILYIEVLVLPICTPKDHRFSFPSYMYQNPHYTTKTWDFWGQVVQVVEADHKPNTRMFLEKMYLYICLLLIF